MTERRVTPKELQSEVTGEELSAMLALDPLGAKVTLGNKTLALLLKDGTRIRVRAVAQVFAPTMELCDDTLRLLYVREAP